MNSQKDQRFLENKIEVSLNTNVIYCQSKLRLFLMKLRYGEWLFLNRLKTKQNIKSFSKKQKIEINFFDSKFRSENKTSRFYCNSCIGNTKLFQIESLNVFLTPRKIRK